MKSLVLLFGMFAVSTSAYAGTLRCTGNSVSLAEYRPDGGPAITPTIFLVASGKIYVDAEPGKPDVQLANYSLEGEQELLKVLAPVDNYEVSYFSQQLKVTIPTEGWEFTEEVVCRQAVYVGPPRP